MPKLRTVSLKDLSNELFRIDKSPITITISGKPAFIAYPYDEKAATKTEAAVERFAGKPVTYDQYRTALLSIGLQQLETNRARVGPEHVIAAENLEETKKRNKLQAAEFLLEAAKFWAGRDKRHICSYCGHRMVPEDMNQEGEQIIYADEQVVTAN